jgi:hypothetical protein
MGFGGYLQANTAVDVLIGPFIDDTDGKTAETALTLSQGDIKLSKNGQALAQKNDNTAAAADANGYYNCELDATDTNTEGTLTLIVHETGALPVRHDFMVLAQAAYISLVTPKDSGYMDVNAKAISEDTAAADNLELACDNYSAARGLSGTALPAAAANAAGGLPISAGGSLALDTKLAATNEITAARMGALTDLIDGGRLDLLIDAIKAMTDKIGTITNTGGTATIGAILGDFANSALAGRVSDARMGALTDWINGGRLDLILDIIAADTTTDIPGTLATIAGYLDTEIAAILADTNELQTDLVNGGRLDVLIDAIKAKTDSLTFTVAGDVDCNIQSVNEIAVDGAGTVGDPWGPVE